MEKKIELFIPGELKDDLVLYNVAREFDLTFKIKEASFSTESGWAFLIMAGEEKEFGRLFTYLADKGISVEDKGSPE